MNKKLLLFTIFVLNSFAGCLAMDKRQPGEGSSSEQHFEQTDRNCAICMQEITGVMSVLPCGHRFCESCINGWRRRHPDATCPLCRQGIPAFDDALLPVQAVPQGQPSVPDQADAHDDECHHEVPAGEAPHVDQLENYLKRMIERWDCGEIKVLISNNPALLHCDNDASMRVALEHQDLGMIRWLIEHGVDVHFDHDAPMRVALGRQDLGMIQWLIEHGVDVHFDHDMSMRVALAHGNCPLVKWLIEHEVDAHFNCDEPMRVALARQDFEMVRWLIEHGVDVHFNHDEPMRAALKWRVAWMIRWLIEHGVSVYFDCNAPIHFALQGYGVQLRIRSDSQDEVEYQNFALLRWLIERGVPVDFYYHSPMRVVLERRSLPMVRWLIAHGEDAHFHGAPMRLALERRDLAMVRWLIEHGEDAHFDHEAPLRLAINCNDTDMINFCCERGGLRTRLVYLFYSTTGRVVGGVVTAATAIAAVTYLKKR